MEVLFTKMCPNRTRQQVLGKTPSGDLKKSLVRTIKLKKVALRSKIFKTWFDKIMSSIIKGSAFNGRLKNTISRDQSLINVSDSCNSVSPVTLFGKYYYCLSDTLQK